MNGRSGLYRKILIGFFLFMLLCTVISRIYDSFTVPKVQTAYAKQKSVETVVTGSGTVKEKETAVICTYPGLRVESVAVSDGSVVSQGDELFRYQMDSLLEKQKELEQEETRLLLSLEKNEISSEQYAQTTQEELAARELILAQEELSRGQKEYDEALERHNANLKKIDGTYKDSLDMTEDELLQDQDRQRQSVSTELKTAQLSRDSEVREAERVIADLEEKLAALGGGPGPGNTGDSPGNAGIATPGNASGGEREALEKELAEKKEDLESLKRSWQLKISEIKYRSDLLNDQYDRIRRGLTSAQDSVKESYESELKQEEDLWKVQEEKEDALERAVEQAQWELEQAKKGDEYARLTKQQQERMAGIDHRLLELDIESIRDESARIEELIASGGKVFADRDGTVVMQEIVKGRTGSGEERVAIAYGSLIFEAEFDKKGQSLMVGDLISVSIPGSSRSVEARIESMNLMGEDTGTFRAELAELNLPIGTVTSYSCRKQSDSYPKVIPAAALRKDSGGYYCLAVRGRNAILGEEFVAERVEVRVEYQGESEAAVDGAFNTSDRLIVAGDQAVFGGERVRPVEELSR